MSTEIREFFERYRSAFDELDGSAVARLFTVPSGIATRRAYTHWPTYEAIERNMTALCDLYRANGYRSASFNPSSIIAQGDDFAIADILWRIERTADLPAWEFHTTYNLMRTPDGWRVLLCTAYEEQRLSA
jgi:hypothetical protein